MASEAQRFCLRWNNYQTSVTSVFESLRQDNELVDVTLCCEGKKVKAHRVLLSACSPYFREILKDNPCQHPVFILKDMGYSDLEALIEFMYNGEVNVIQTRLGSFLKAAEALQIKGLAGEQDDAATDKENEEAASPPGVPSVNSTGPSSPLPQVPNRRAVSPLTRPSSPPVKRKKRHHSNSSSHSIHEVSQPATKEEVAEILPIQPKIELPDVDSESVSVDESASDHRTNYDDAILTQFGDIKNDFQNSFNSNDGLPSQQPGPSTAVLPSISSLPSETGDHLLIPPGPSTHKVDTSQSQGEPHHHHHPSDQNKSLMENVSVTVDVSPTLPLPVVTQDVDVLPASLLANLAVVGNAVPPRSSVRRPPLPRVGINGSSLRHVYSCEVCGRRFKAYNSLSMHRGLHRGETFCQVCRRVFSRRSNLVRHMLQKHDLHVEVRPLHQKK